MKQQELAKKKLKLNIFWIKHMSLANVLPEHHFVVCIANAGYTASLEQCKIYEMIPDGKAEQHQYCRIVDESGESYLYPQTLFLPIALTSNIEAAILKAA